jgi:hypothetical protein
MLIGSAERKDFAVLHKFLHARGVTVAADPESLRMIGRLGNSGELLGVVAYNAWNGRTCSMHCAGDGNWINRELLRAAFEYPFVTCDMALVLAPVPADNRRALRLDQHLGFKPIYRVARGWSWDVDLVFLGMHRHECRWLNSRQLLKEAA